MNKPENNGSSLAPRMAHAAYGTVKAGKAIAAAAPFAAAVGPYGAAAGLAVAAGRHSGKLLAGAVLLLMLPILFVVMLPTLIFGRPSEDPSKLILNDNAAIIRNVNDITFAVNSVLGEGITDVKERIALDFAGTDGDNYEVVDPYSDDMTSNINVFVAQYCASKGETCTDISLTDLEAIIRQNKGSLYSYTRTSETRTVEDDDPDTADVVETKEELWYVYTLSYNGEGYFADAVFHLSDEQKEQATNYAENLSLFLGDGTIQHTPYDGSVLSSLSVMCVLLTELRRSFTSTRGMNAGRINHTAPTTSAAMAAVPPPCPS